MSVETSPVDVEKRTPNRPKAQSTPRVIDGGTGSVVPLQRTPLRSLEHVRRELARTYRAVKVGHLASDEGSKRAYILVQLGKIIEAADLERRLEVLERAQRLLPAPDAEAVAD